LDLLCNLKPKLIIVHGSKAKNEFVKLLKYSGMIHDDDWLEKSSESLEQSKSVRNVRYSIEEAGTATVCRSLMYYGTSGDSFNGFRSFIQHLK
jgi:hypothetical protein